MLLNFSKIKYSWYLTSCLAVCEGKNFLIRMSKLIEIILPTLTLSILNIKKSDFSLIWKWHFYTACTSKCHLHIYQVHVFETLFTENLLGDIL